MTLAAKTVCLILLLVASAPPCAAWEDSQSRRGVPQDIHTGPIPSPSILQLERSIGEIERYAERKQRMTLFFETACLLFFAFDLLLVFFALREYSLLKAVLGAQPPGGKTFTGRNRIIAALAAAFCLAGAVVWARPLILPDLWLDGGIDMAIASAYAESSDSAAASAVLLDSIDDQFLSQKLYRDAVYAFFLVFWVGAELFILVVILKAGLLLKDSLFRGIGVPDA